MLPRPRDWAAAKECVGEQLTNKEAVTNMEAVTNKEAVTNTKAHQAPKKDRWVWFAVEISTARPTKQDQQAPIKMIGGCSWSPGIYQAPRLLGKSLDVAWERVFIHPLTFKKIISDQGTTAWLILTANSNCFLHP